jgi:predicted lipoprotein with Yx(FWY)xxD motif
MRTLIVLIAAAALAGSAAAATPAPAVVGVAKTGLGRVLVDDHGKTLYLFEADKGARSSCYGQCAVFWPPYVTAAAPRAGAGAQASLLATSKRRDGKLQVTYAGHPLYTFKSDAKPGQTKGEAINAFGGEWYAVSPRGAKVEASKTASSSSSSSSNGGYGASYGGYGN